MYADMGIKRAIDCLLEAFDAPTEIMVDDHLPPDLSPDDVLVPVVYPTVSDIPSHLVQEILSSKVITIPHFVWEYETIPYQYLSSVSCAPLITTQSSFTKRLIPHKRVEVTPLPITEFKKRKKETGRTYRIGFAISAHPRKNQKDIIELANRLPNPYKLVILFPTKTQIPLLPPEGQKLLDHPKVEIVDGPITDDDELNEFYLSLDWFVSFSLGEGYNLPVREALKCGVPVIVGRHTGHRDLPQGDFVYYYKTIEDEGKKYGIPQPVVYRPDLNDVLKVIVEREPPTVPENLPLPTMKDWKERWKEVLEKVRHPVLFDLKEPPKVVFLVHDNYYCGLRAVSSMWAKRVGPSVKVMTFSEAVKSSLPEKIVAIFPYALHFFHHFQFHLYVLQFKRRNPSSKVIVWCHSIPPDYEMPTAVAIGDGFMATSDYISAHLPNRPPVLWNPLGNPPRTTERLGRTVLIFGVVMQYFQYFLHLLVYLPRMAIGWNFIYVISPTPFIGDLNIVGDIVWELKRKTEGLSNVKIIPEYLTDEELEDLMDRCDVYLVPIPENPQGGRIGELTARVPTVLRKGRPVLTSYVPDRLGPYLQFVRPVIPYTERTIYQILSSSQVLQSYIPVNVPPEEYEVEMFWKAIEEVRRKYHWDED